MSLVRSTGDEINIIESGTNENGNWIKFENGILIQYGNRDISNIQINTSSIGNYMSAGQNINFPISFKEAICGNVSLRGGSAFFTTKRFISNTLMGYFVLSGSSATLSSAILDWFAIGTWK